jgi:hypothetical protein
VRLDRLGRAVVEAVSAALKIRPGAEAPSSPREDDDANVVVAIDLVVQVQQVAQHLGREAVQSIGPVQRNHQDAVRQIGRERLVRHDLLAARARRGRPT